MSIVVKVMVGWILLALLALIFNWAFWKHEKRLRKRAEQQRELANEQLRRIPDDKQRT